MKKSKRIFKKVAKQNGTTEKEVKNQIDLAIKIAAESTEKSPEGELFWAELTKKGEAVTPDEVIAAILTKLIAK